MRQELVKKHRMPVKVLEGQHLDMKIWIPHIILPSGCWCLKNKVKLHYFLILSVALTKPAYKNVCKVSFLINAKQIPKS